MMMMLRWEFKLNSKKLERIEAKKYPKNYIHISQNKIKKKKWNRILEEDEQINAKLCCTE